MSDMADEEGVGGGGGDGGDTDTSSDDSPVPLPEVPAGVLEEEEGETGEVDSLEEDAEVEVDLKAMADDYAKYLVVDSPKDVNIVLVIKKKLGWMFSCGEGGF